MGRTNNVKYVIILSNISVFNSLIREEKGGLKEMKFVERVTDLEEDYRDRALGSWLNQIMPSWVHPNHISILRLVLLSVAILLFFYRRPLMHQVWILVAAALTDALDGPIARARNLQSRIGAYLDHGIDWALGAWAGILALVNGLLSLGLIANLVAPQAVLTVLDRIRASRIAGRQGKDRALTIAMGAANFRPTAFARIQFVAVLLGFLLLLYSKSGGSPFFRSLGLFCLYLEIALAWFLVVEGLYRLVGNEPEGR